MKIMGYVAASLDGYVADARGGVEWLKPYEAVETGYDRFVASVSTVVMGRVTYDGIPAFGVGWPYPGKQGIVVTSRPLPAPGPGVRPWHEGPARLARHLRAQDAGDAWIVGGPGLQGAFMAAGELDLLHLFVVPILLGDGIPLFPLQRRHRTLALRGVKALDRGLVHLAYGIG